MHETTPSVSALVTSTQSPAQEIMDLGKSVAVMRSHNILDQRSGTQRSLVDLMRHSPLAVADDVAFERDRSLTRTIAL